MVAVMIVTTGASDYSIDIYIQADHVTYCISEEHQLLSWRSLEVDFEVATKHVYIYMYSAPSPVSLYPFYPFR